MEEKERLMNIITEFEKQAIGIATDFYNSGYVEYESARNNLLVEPFLYTIIPEWIVKNRWGSQFRTYMQNVSGHYAPRREFIRNSIHEFRMVIELGTTQPVSISFNEVKSAIKNSSIESLWKKIQLRRENDPEGAITASRTMLESVLKHILDELGEKYSEKDDLPDLYKSVSKKLNLSPGNHDEQIFKQILQGISSVVLGYSSLRNKFGDAHGKGKDYVGPDRRHADLVVNLSGSICIFLMETFEVRLKK